MGDGYAIRLNSVEYDAGDDRAALTALVMGAGAATARAGRRPGPGLTVTIGGTPEAATLSPGVCIVTDPVGGMYLVAFPNNVTKTLATRPGTGTSRNDLAVARIYDADVHSADTTLREVDFELVTGTASASPSTPTLPDGALLLETLTVPATGTISVNQNGPRTVAAGGILPVASQTERDALTAYDGLMVYREDTDTYEARVDGGWKSMMISDGPELTLRITSDKTIPSVTPTTISWDTAGTNTGGMWTSGGNITVTKAGVYSMDCTTQWGVNNPDNAVAAGIYVNGSAYRWQGGSAFTNEQGGQQSVHMTMRLAVGDVITFRVTQNVSTSQPLKSSGTAGTRAAVIWLRN